MTEINYFHLRGRGAADEKQRAGLGIPLISINEFSQKRLHYWPRPGVHC